MAEDVPGGITALSARVREDLALLCLPAKPWVPPQSRDGWPVEDVVVVGAGMSGLALAAALKHLGIGVLLLDRASAGLEGPWLTTARMETLRSPKELTGPALGIPSLTFRAWFTAQQGGAAWGALDKIPRPMWAHYLQWYRQVLDLPVLNRQAVVAVEPRADGVVAVGVVDLDTPERVRRTVLARHVALATGRDGLGGPWLPDWAAGLPRDRWVHSADDWPDDRFAGQRVAVIGAGASAMDSAATALEHGAARVDLLIRRTELPRINKSKGSGSPGMAHGFWALPDAWKWRFRHHINTQQVPPPRGSTLRVSRHPNAHFQLGTWVERVGLGADLTLHTNRGPLSVDAVIFSTGFRTDWLLRPEFAALAPQVRLWHERYTPPQGLDTDPELSGSPDLGPLFEFLPKAPGACPGLERVHCFNFAAALSMGAVSGDIPQISDGAQRLARGLAASLLAEDAPTHFEALTRYAEPELLGDEWTPAVFPVATEPHEPV